MTFAMLPSAITRCPPDNAKVSQSVLYTSMRAAGKQDLMRSSLLQVGTCFGKNLVRAASVRPAGIVSQVRGAHREPCDEFTSNASHDLALCYVSDRPQCLRHRHWLTVT